MGAPSTETPSSSSRHLVIMLLVAVAVVLLAGAVTTWLLLDKSSTSRPNKAVVTDLEKELKRSNMTVAPTEQRIVSSLGFSLAYTPDTLTARGQTTDPTSTDTYIKGESFDADELKVERPYSMIRIESRGAVSLAAPQLTINTNIRAEFWNRFKGEKDVATRKLQLLTAHLTKSMTDEQTSAATPTTVTIGGISYQRVILSRDNSSYGVSRASEIHLYVTVQNDRPYWAVIYNATVDAAVTAQFERVLSTVTYHAPTASLLGATASSFRLAAVTVPEDTANTPDELDTDTVIPVVLRNQPAVVRIVAVRCGSVVLQKGTHRVELPRSCNGGVGSGSFISSDGYIATNGHVVAVTDTNLLSQALSSLDSVSRLLDFLVKAKMLTDAQRTAFLEALRHDDSAARSALAQLPQAIPTSLLSVVGESYQYGIQTSNQPMRIQGWSITYDDTILPATLIDMDFDPMSAEKALSGGGVFTSSDVAILKADGTFPTVSLAPGASLKQGDRVTAIGYPAFVDNALSTTQWQTVPTVTQGTISAILDDASTGGRIAGTSVQIAPGNSGGPAFNEAGEQGGLMTYGKINCLDQRCFGDGSFRDVADLHKLIRKNNITLSRGHITDEWSDGLDAYAAGDYQKALQHFDVVKREYPANYLAPELSRVARSKLGTETDTSGTRGIPVWAIAVLTTLLGGGVITGVISSILLIQLKRRQSGAEQLYIG